MKRGGSIVLVAGLVGCDVIDPRVGEQLNPACSSEDSDPDQDVSFAAEIRPLIQGETESPGCGCHLSTDDNPIGIELSGLDLTTLGTLRAGGNNSGSDIVVPGDPCSSVFWQKVTPGPPFGSRMPFDAPPFLTEDAQRRIADWIAEGARDN